VFQQDGGRPPVVTCRGTSPNHAARSRARVNVSALPMAATIAVALSAPIPGIVVRRRAAVVANAMHDLVVESRDTLVESSPLGTGGSETSC
jgi:hypothetical protein